MIFLFGKRPECGLDAEGIFIIRFLKVLAMSYTVRTCVWRTELTRGCAGEEELGGGGEDISLVKPVDGMSRREVAVLLYRYGVEENIS